MRKTTLKEVIISAASRFWELLVQVFLLLINRVREIQRQLREIRESVEISFSISSKPGAETKIRSTIKDLILPSVIATVAVLTFVKGCNPTPIVSAPTPHSPSIFQKTNVKCPLQEGRYKVFVTEDPTNFRSSDEAKDGKDSNFIGHLRPKDKLIFLNFNEDRSWQCVRLEETNEEGWVNSQYIRKN